MKATIILLAIIGLSYSGAEAQTKTAEATKPCKCHSKKTVKGKNGQIVHKHHVNKARVKTATNSDTYQVCREEGGHYTCCKHKTTTTTTAVTK